MKLTRKAVQKILEGDTRAFLCSGLGGSYHKINRWLRDNKVDGPLTTASSLEIIEKHTGLTQDKILEKVK